MGKGRKEVFGVKLRTKRTGTGGEDGGGGRWKRRDDLWGVYLQSLYTLKNTL